MRVLLIGSGGREHALAWKLAQSPTLTELFCAPGNPGTAACGMNLALDTDDHAAVLAAVKHYAIDLVVVGPEAPLVNGLANVLHAAGHTVFGPSQEAAELEGSKAFCKALLERHHIPTAGYRAYSGLNSALSYLETGASYPVVVKASGLAAGKGVIIAKQREEARAAVESMLRDGTFGAAGEEIVIEEFLRGTEASMLALTDGRTFIPLEPCQDHKQRFEAGQGPNTGGMGAVCPTPAVSERMRDIVERQVFLPTLHGMSREGRPFRGVIYAGLMLGVAGPKVLEYNVRFGDPECQPLMHRLRSDLLPLLHAAAVGDLDSCSPPEWDPRFAVCVVAVADGYPGPYKKGVPIEGVSEFPADESLQLFQAGTSEDASGQLVTAGGRVLSVSALGDSLETARTKAYEALKMVHFDGMSWRTDIGATAVEPTPLV